MKNDPKVFVRISDKQGRLVTQCRVRLSRIPKLQAFCEELIAEWSDNEAVVQIDFQI